MFSTYSQTLHEIHLKRTQQLWQNNLIKSSKTLPPVQLYTGKERHFFLTDIVNNKGKFQEHVENDSKTVPKYVQTYQLIT